MTEAVEPLWPIPISILGVTGKYSSGKTIFLCSIAHPSRTLIYDTEKSSESYIDLMRMGLTRVDVPQELANKFGEKPFTQRDLFIWWVNDIAARIKPGQFDVIACDVADDLEIGLVEYVKSQYATYGYHSAESFYKTGGIFWSKVKAEWKRITIKLATLCQTYAFSTHLKQVWRGKKPIDKWVPKGKSTLMESAQLYLFLDRDGDQTCSQAPSATMAEGKYRVASHSWVDGQLKTTPLLPPRIPVATPAAIRKYMETPPDFTKLTDEEKAHEKELSEGERLELEMEIAEANKEAAEAQQSAAKLELQKDAARRAAAYAVVKPDAQPPAEAPKEKGTEATPDEQPTTEEIKALMELAKQNGKDEKVRANLRQILGVERVTVGAIKKLPRDRFNKMITYVKGEK